MNELFFIKTRRFISFYFIGGGICPDQLFTEGVRPEEMNTTLETSFGTYS